MQILKTISCDACSGQEGPYYDVKLNYILW